MWPYLVVAAKSPPALMFSVRAKPFHAMLTGIWRSHLTSRLVFEYSIEDAVSYGQLPVLQPLRPARGCRQGGVTRFSAQKCEPLPKKVIGHSADVSEDRLKSSDHRFGGCVALDGDYLEFGIRVLDEPHYREGRTR